MKADEREIRRKPLLVNVGQGRTDARSESGQRSCPKGEDRPKPIRISRTTATRIFSPVFVDFWPYISKNYRGVHCSICTTVQDCAQLIHAEIECMIPVQIRFGSDSVTYRDTQIVANAIDSPIL